jgi:hypothetical protein
MSRTTAAGVNAEAQPRDGYCCVAFRPLPDLA